MPGGSNCAIVGCTAQKAKNRGLTFHVIPKKGKKEQWRGALIKKINRVDCIFNPDKATICSRHFTDSCFRYGPSGIRHLIPGSLPTEFMPCKSVETSKPMPRRPLPERLPPEVPERVAYYTLEEVQKDARNLPSPWALLSQDASHLTLASIDLMLDQVKIKVSISEDLTANIFVFGKKVPGVTHTLEKIKLKDFLRNLAQSNTCSGIGDPLLQEYVDVYKNDDPKQVYYRDCSSGQSVIRGVQCVLLFLGTTDLQTCSACKHAKRLAERKQARAIFSRSKPIHKHDPLRFTSKEKLSSELKSARKMNRTLQEKVEALKRGGCL